MAGSTPEFVAYLIDELSDQREVSARRFFGGWQLRSEDRQFAIFMNGTLFFKVEDTLSRELQRMGGRPFSYAKQGKQVLVAKYMSAPEGVLDDMDLLRVWVERVIAAP